MPAFDPALLERNKAVFKQASPFLDQLSKTWEQFEEFFRSQGILRGATLTYREIYAAFPHDDHEVGSRLIGVQKVKGSWRICYASVYDDSPDDRIDWVPVGEAPTHLRIELLDQVLDLFAALVKSNEEYLGEIEEAAKKSQEILKELQFAGL